MSASGRIASVIVPCRNEHAFIARFCEGVLRQRLPDGWALELIVADGLSDDGTREVLLQFAARDARIQIVDNPGRIVSAGLNRALASAAGEAIVRMDVHTEYADDYIAQCLAALADSGADNVGGPWCAEAGEGATPMQRAIAAAFQSRWVAGGALSRRLDFSGLVDTVYLGCWPRASFERFGTFDETLVRNQDDEHNLRIVRSGGRVWQSARIRSRYRPRAALGALFRQYLQYGYWKPFVMKKHQRPASLRHVAPGLLVALLVLTAAGGAIGAPWWPLMAVAGPYAAMLSAMTLLVARGSPGLGIGTVLRLPAVIAAQHLGYGIGSLLGAWDAFSGRGGRERFGRLTR